MGGSESRDFSISFCGDYLLTVALSSSIMSRVCSTAAAAVVLLHLTLIHQPASASDGKCRHLLLKNGLSANFNETVAHSIHSMTVEGLQMFNPRATIDNHVPTVNMDRHSPEKVVPFAPADPLGDDFWTEPMNIVDKILQNVGKDNDGLGRYWSPLERVVHKFHMNDVWARVHTVFQSKVVQNPPSEDVCSCLLDTRDNGIYAAVEWVSDHYDSGTPITLLNRPIPKLTDAASWDVWRTRLLYYYQPAALYDSALYLYCATKDF